MTVNSLSFLIFFVLVAIVYFLPFLKKYQWIVLLAASYLFFLSFGVRPVIYILITTVTTYLAARKLGRLREEQISPKERENMNSEDIRRWKDKNKKKRNHVILAHVLINVGLLILLKYGNFFISNMNKVLEQTSIGLLPSLSLVVPLGISYYTLQSIGYVVDVSKGKVRCEKNIGKTALFLSYFPQMTQGPIGRFGQLGKQLFSQHAFSYRNLSFGCQRILWGFFKKTVIADRLKPLVDEILINYQSYSGMTLFLGCVYMSIQAYADFSGYMDIIAGFSEILGIHVEENFKRPFFSKSLAEYWRRWHITLSSWFRDYLFYPLSLSKTAVKLGRNGKKVLPVRIAKLIPSVYALCIVWFTTGFWHAASWRYILWGVCNGVVLIASTCLTPQYQAVKKGLHIREGSRWWQLVCMARTFLLVSFLKVFPGAESTGDALGIIKRIFCRFSPQLSYEAWFPGMAKSGLAYILFGLILFFAVSCIQEHRQVRDWLSARPFAVRWALYLMLLCSVLSFGILVTDVSGGFEYAQY